MGIHSRVRKPRERSSAFLVSSISVVKANLAWENKGRNLTGDAASMRFVRNGWTLMRWESTFLMLSLPVD